MMKQTETSTDIDSLYQLLIKLPINSKKYRKCVEDIRKLETGGHTLGLNSSLSPVSTSTRSIDIHISKAL